MDYALVDENTCLFDNIDMKSIAIRSNDRLLRFLIYLISSIII